MSISNKFVFIVLTIVAWIIFVALCIEAGGLLVNFVFSLFKPEVVHNLYQKLDLSQLYASSPWAYYSMYSYILVIAGMKAFLFYVVVMLVTRLDLAKPFSAYVSLQISRISYFTLAIGILSYLARETTRELRKRGFDTDALSQFWVDSQAFIIMAAIIYIIAVIFRKGVELQNENDLTV
jgi:hypothetical protein